MNTVMDRLFIELAHACPDARTHRELALEKQLLIKPHELSKLIELAHHGVEHGHTEKYLEVTYADGMDFIRSMEERLK